MDSPTTFPYVSLPTIPGFFTMPLLPTVPDIFTIPMPLGPATMEPNTLLLSISLAVRVVLFVTCLIENSIAIFILHKNLKNGRKTFSGYMLINMAGADILNALLYYPAEFVRFSQGEFVWLVQGETGDVLCKLYSFLVQIPGKVFILCLVALACDVTRNLSSKGRREHTRQVSAITMILFWIFAAGHASTYIVISEVSPTFEYKLCIADPAKQETALMMDLLHRFMFVIPANFILAILNLVIYCRVKRSKKEIIRKREIRRAARTKVRREMKQIGDEEGAKVQRLTNPEEAQEMLLSESCKPGEEDFIVETRQQRHTSSNPSDTWIEMPTETNEVRGSSDIDVEEEIDPSGIGKTALVEAFDMSREEAKIESITASIFIILTLIMLILPFFCEDPDACNAYVFFAVQIALDIYGVIKPGIFAYIDKEFRRRYKQLSPFTCCCLRRLQCHTVGTRNNLPYKCEHTVVDPP